MYDGKNIKIQFFAKDNLNCSPPYCLQLVSLFCCDTWMPNSTCVLCHWVDNGLVVIQQIIRRHSSGQWLETRLGTWRKGLLTWPERLDLRLARNDLRLDTKDLRLASDLMLETCVHLWSHMAFAWLWHLTYIYRQNKFHSYTHYIIWLMLVKQSRLIQPTQYRTHYKF